MSVGTAGPTTAGTRQRLAIARPQQSMPRRPWAPLGTGRPTLASHHNGGARAENPMYGPGGRRARGAPAETRAPLRSRPLASSPSNATGRGAPRHPLSRRARGRPRAPLLHRVPPTPVTRVCSPCSTRTQLASQRGTAHGQRRNGGATRAQPAHNSCAGVPTRVRLVLHRTAHGGTYHLATPSAPQLPQDRLGRDPASRTSSRLTSAVGAPGRSDDTAESCCAARGAGAAASAHDHGPRCFQGVSGTGAGANTWWAQTPLR